MTSARCSARTFLENRPARDDDVAATTVHLEDLERLLETHQGAGVAHGAHVDLAAGQERDGTAEIDREATLDAAEDRAFDTIFLAVGFFQTVPGGFATGHLVADDGFALGVLDVAQKDFDFIADFDFRRFARLGEFLEIDAAFHLVADVDDGLAGFDRQHFALDHRPFGRRVDFEAFVQESFELFHGCIGSHMACDS